CGTRLPPPRAAPRGAGWRVAQPQTRAGTRGPGGTASRRRCVGGCDTSLFSPFLMGTASFGGLSLPRLSFDVTRQHRLQIHVPSWGANVMPPVPTPAMALGLCDDAKTRYLQTGPSHHGQDDQMASVDIVASLVRCRVPLGEARGALIGPLQARCVG